jgi:hypothetical protein
VLFEPPSHLGVLFMETLANVQVYSGSVLGHKFIYDIDNVWFYHSAWLCKASCKFGFAPALYRPVTCSL